MTRGLVFSSTDRLRKKATHRSKELREKRPNPGYFCFNAEGGRFFGQRKNVRVASLAIRTFKTIFRENDFEYM
jgi:hypothetical protein